MFRRILMFLFVTGAAVPVLAQQAAVSAVFHTDVDALADRETARILVYFLKEQGAPVSEPAQ